MEAAHSQHLQTSLFPYLDSLLKAESSKYTFLQKFRPSKYLSSKHPYQTIGFIKLLMRPSLTAKRHHFLMTQICYLSPLTIYMWEGMPFLSRSYDFLHVDHTSLPNLTFSFLFTLCITCVPSWWLFPGCRRFSGLASPHQGKKMSF